MQHHDVLQRAAPWAEAPPSYQSVLVTGLQVGSELLVSDGELADSAFDNFGEAVLSIRHRSVSAKKDAEAQEAKQVGVIATAQTSGITDEISRLEEKNRSFAKTYQNELKNFTDKQKKYSKKILSQLSWHWDDPRWDILIIILRLNWHLPLLLAELRSFRLSEISKHCRNQGDKSVAKQISRLRSDEKSRKKEYVEAAFDLEEDFRIRQHEKYLTTQDALVEIRRISGLEWSELVQILNVDRTSLNLWFSSYVPEENEAGQIRRLLSFIRWIDRGKTVKNKKLIRRFFSENRRGNVHQLARKFFRSLLEAVEFSPPLRRGKRQQLASGADLAVANRTTLDKIPDELEDHTYVLTGELVEDKAILLS